MKPLAILIGLRVIACAVSAQEPRSQPLPVDQLPTNPGGSSFYTLGVPPAVGIRLGTLVISFDSISMAELEAKIGPTPGTYKKFGFSCYRFDSPLGKATIWLTPSKLGENFTAVVIAIVDSRQESKCPNLPSSRQPVALMSGLKLGDAAQQLIRTVGSDVLLDKSNNSFTFQYSRPSKATRCSSATTSSTLFAMLPQGRISYLAAEREDFC